MGGWFGVRKREHPKQKTVTGKMVGSRKVLGCRWLIIWFSNRYYVRH